jgi:hypothetical protein
MAEGEIMADKPPDKEDKAAASGGHGHAATPPLPTKGVSLSKKKGSLEDTLSTVTPPILLNHFTLVRARLTTALA